MSELKEIVNIEEGNQPESTKVVTGENLAKNDVSFSDDGTGNGEKADEEAFADLANECDVCALADQGPNLARPADLEKMDSHKEKGSYALAEDVYAFITVAPVNSWSFVFAISVISIKYVVYTTLFVDIFKQGLGGSPSSSIAVKFFLIPVAVAMQEDLMRVFASVANARYDPKVLQISRGATRAKFNLGYLLRFFDGAFSLCVNFMLMLRTQDVLSVFLNFAALHFLQDIDDVFYILVEKGFFGDKMEHMSYICKQISWPRRRGSNKLSALATNLDSILFALTLVLLFTVYFYITFKYEIWVSKDVVHSDD